MIFQYPACSCIASHKSLIPWYYLNVCFHQGDDLFMYNCSMFTFFRFSLSIANHDRTARCRNISMIIVLILLVFCSRTYLHNVPTLPATGNCIFTTFDVSVDVGPTNRIASERFLVVYTTAVISQFPDTSVFTEQESFIYCTRNSTRYPINITVSSPFFWLTSFCFHKSILLAGYGSTISNSAHFRMCRVRCESQQ